MTIDTNDTGTTDLLDRNGEHGDTGPNTRVAVKGFGTGTIAELETHLDVLTHERDSARLGKLALEVRLAPLEVLADALAALPVFVEMASDLEDVVNRVGSLEVAAEEIPTVEAVVQELEYSGSIESAVETILADRSDDPADNIDTLAAAVADRLSVDVEIDNVDVEIDNITVEASATVSVS